MSFRSACLCVVFAAASSLSLGGQAQSPPAITLLDRYAAGQFDSVVAELDGLDDFGRLLKDLKGHADEWIAAGGPTDRARRELAAATFALEAARVDEWREWKWIQEPPPSTTPHPTLYWQPPPLLIEWGCELFRKDKDAAPRSIERIWQLAALAVAQRSEDAQFLIGFTEIEQPKAAPAPSRPTASRPAGSATGIPNVRVRPRNQGIEVSNVQDEIGHLNHTMDRFPKERRFMLGQGIARERDAATDAVQIYKSLAGDPDVGGEAMMRLGALQVRQNRVADAMDSFDRAGRLTRDPDVLYLTGVFRGQALLRTRKETDAVAAFRAALAARPATETASLQLAELLFKFGNRTEAQSIMAAVLAVAPGAHDPYLEIVHADDRFWPRLIARLRREIKP